MGLGSEGLSKFTCKNVVTLLNKLIILQKKSKAMIEDWLIKIASVKEAPSG